MKIEGHTDDVGNPKRNKALSLSRAQSVKAMLVKLGIDEGRLETVGFGGSRPKVSVARRSRREVRKARAQNRRVEFNFID